MKVMKIIAILLIPISFLMIGLGVNDYLKEDYNKKTTIKPTKKAEKEPKEDSEETKEDPEQTKNEYEDKNYKKPEDIGILDDFIGYRGQIGKDNMLADKDLRIEYIQFLLMHEKKVTESKGPGQSFPYISNEKFKEKYLETYGTKTYKYEEDQDSTKFIDCEEYEETKNKNYKCWNGTWGVYGDYIYFYVDKKNETPNNYIISGKYKRKSNAEGTFEFEFIKENGNKYISRITMKESS